MPGKTDTSSKKTPKKLRIGAVLYGLTNPYFDQIKSGLNTRTKEYIDDIEVVMRQTEYNVEKQLEAIKEVMKDGIDGLILTPMEDSRVKDIINELAAKKIPTICVNTDLEESDRVVYVGSDLYKSGRTAGEMMGMITPNNNWEVGIITGSRQLKSHEDRIRGFCDVLKESYPNLVVERIEECNGDDYKAYEIMRIMLENHPHMHAFFFTAGGVYGGCKFLYQMTKPRPYYVVTFDELDTTREFIRNGTINASICQQPFVQGRMALALAVQYILHGNVPAEKNYTDIVIRIKENL